MPSVGRLPPKSMRYWKCTLMGMSYIILLSLPGVCVPDRIQCIRPSYAHDKIKINLYENYCSQDVRSGQKKVTLMITSMTIYHIFLPESFATGGVWFQHLRLRTYIPYLFTHCVIICPSQSCGPQLCAFDCASSSMMHDLLIARR